MPFDAPTNILKNVSPIHTITESLPFVSLSQHNHDKFFHYFTTHSFNNDNMIDNTCPTHS